MRILLSVLLLIAGVATASPQSEGYIVKSGTLPVPETVAKIEAAIEAAPPTLMAKIDHGANAEKADLELGPSVLLIFGAPRIGTPIMQTNPMAGLDLPVKVLVWEEDEGTRIGYLDPATLGARHGVGDAAAAQLEQMGKALDAITEKGVR